MPDKLDWQIIDLLQKDGRATNAGIAEKLDVAEGTVRTRLKRLIETGTLKVSGLVNPEFLEHYQLMLIGMNVKESRQLESTAEAVSRLPQVRSVAITSGRYDLVVEVIVESNHGIIKFLSESLSTVTGITTTETFVCLKTYNYWIGSANDPGKKSTT